MRKVFKFLGKLLKWVLISVFLLLVLVAIIVKVPAVHDFILNKGTQYFNNKTGGHLSVQSIDLRIPSYVSLKGISLETPHQEKLAEIGNVEVSLGWRYLFKKTIRIDKFILEDVNARVENTRGKTWNYDFIVQAFANEDAAPPPDDDSSASWDFSLGHAALNRINAIYYDAATGDSVVANLGEVTTDIKRLSILKDQYEIDELNLNNSTLFARLGDDVEENNSANADSDREGDFDFHLGNPKINFVHNTLTFQMGEALDTYFVETGKINLHLDEIDLNRQVFAIDKLELEDTYAEMTVAPTESDSIQDLNDIFLPIQLNANRVYLKSAGFKMQTIGQEGDEMALDKIHVELHDFMADENQYSGSIKSATGVYNRLDRLQDFRTHFLITRQSIALPSLFAQYGASTLQAEFSVGFNDLNRLVDSLEFNELKLNISNTHFEPGDLKNIGEALALPDSVWVVPGQPVTLTAAARGDAENLQLDRLEIAMGNTHLHVEGSAQGKNWGEKTYLLPVFNLHLERDDLHNILQAFEIDAGTIPHVLDVNAQGNFEEFDSDLQASLLSSFGNVNLTANGGGWKSETLPVEANVVSKRLDIGSFIGMDVPFHTDFNIQASANNILDTNIFAQISLFADSLVYDSYRLHHIQAHATTEKQAFTYELMVVDTFVAAELSGHGTLAPHLSFHLGGNFEGIDFYALGLSKKDMRGQLALNAEYHQNQNKQWGKANLSDAIFVQDSKRYELQPANAIFYLSPDSSMADVKSEFFELNTVTNGDIDGLTQALASVFTQGEKTHADSTAYWEAHFKSYEPAVLKELFLPELNSFQPATASIRFNAAESKLDAEADFPEIIYGDMAIDSLSITAHGNEENLNAHLKINRAGIDSLALQNIHLNAHTTEKSTLVEFMLKDEKNKDNNYYIGIDLVATADSTTHDLSIQLIDSLVLNKEIWNTDPRNDIQFTQEGIEINQLQIFRENSRLGFHKHSRDDKVHIKAVDFNLTALSGMILTDNDLLTGRLFGDFELFSNKTFAGNGRIEDFKIAQADFGLFSWNAEGRDEKLKVSISSTGDDMDFTVAGDVTSPGEDEVGLNLKVNLDKFTFEALQKFAPTMVTHGKGSLTGNMSVTGTTQKPNLKGELHFNENEIGLIANGAIYKIDNQKITILPKEILFQNFLVTDSANNELTVNGNITHRYFDDVKTNLRIKANDFEIANLAAEAHQGYYGRLLANLDVSVKGKIDAPKIEAGIKISDKTELTVVVPESEYHDDFDEEMIVWTNFDHADEDEIITRTPTKRATAQNAYRGMLDLNGTINIDEHAILRILIDSLAGDYLEIQGGGNLGVTYDRTGNLNLNGNYLVKNGFYQMTFYNLVKRKFNFQEGSRLTWNGDPMDADIDITALYKTNVNVATLMTSQSGVKSNEAFSQKLPFEVVMHISGELMKPELKFSIQLAKESKGALGGAVDARLNEIAGDESELNKQVFALLVLNTFINTESSSDHNFLANQARSSASQILSQQLNALSDKLISGVDLNFDIESYELGGQGTTDLNIDLAKSFMDDRIIVRVGSTIALEDNQQNTQNSQEMMTSFSLEYKLTPEGVYRLKFFRTNDLEDIVVGRITRTGGGILYQKDFNKLRNIFQVKSDLIDPRTEDLEIPENPKENAIEEEEEQNREDIE